MAEDFTGSLRKFLYVHSSKIKQHRSRAQELLEKEVYLKATSYFQKLKLDIQFFHMEATTTSIYHIRKAFLLFLAVPTSIVAQYYVIMEVFYKIFVFDVGVVKRKKIFPLNLPADEDITYWPMWRVFVEHYLISYDFWILFALTSFVVYWIVIATASTNFLWSSDPDLHEKNLDKRDFSHMALQVALKARGDIAYLYEFKRVEMFVKSEVYLHLLSLDVHLFLGTKPVDQINKEADLIMNNLEFYLEQVAHMLLQLREDAASKLQDPRMAQRKKIANLKLFYKHIYDLDASESATKVYQALYVCWLFDGIQGIVDYFAFEHTLQKKAPVIKKKIGKEHPFYGYRSKFSKKQSEIRLKKKLLFKTIVWRRHRWLFKHFEEQHGITDGFEKLKKWKIEKRAIDNEDLVDYLIELFNDDDSDLKKKELKNVTYANNTVWANILQSLFQSSFGFKYFVFKRKAKKNIIELKALWDVIYDKYLEKFFGKRKK